MAVRSLDLSMVRKSSSTQRLDQQLLAVDMVSGKHPLFIGLAGKLHTSAHTHTTFSRRSPLAQTSATRLHTTDCQRRLSPTHKHSQMNSEPKHIKANSQCDQTHTLLSFIRTPTVSRPEGHVTNGPQSPWPNRFLMLSDSQQTVICEDKSLTSKVQIK